MLNTNLAMDHNKREYICRLGYGQNLLYYFGILAQAGMTNYGEMILAVPNLVARGFVSGPFARAVADRLRRQKRDCPHRPAVCQRGNLQPLCDFPILSNPDYRSANELMLKILCMTVLHNDNL